MNLIGNINAIPFRRFRGGGGVVPFPSIPGMIARYSASGLTNEQMAANPVWVDKTGNGHDLQLKNFLWGGMSGCDGYTESFLGDTVNWESEIYNGRKMSVFGGSRNRVNIIHNQYYFQTYVKISGINDNEGKVRGVYFYILGSPLTEGTLCRTDGIYKIDITGSDKSKVVAIWAYPAKKNEEDYDYPVTIEILPLYPGALVFDGVDDYGTCDNFPILTKEKGYTVVALRQYLVEKSTAYLTANGDSISNTSFILEGNNYRDTWNFGKATTIQASRILATQTSKQYDGVKLNIGTNTEGSNLLQVGKWSKSYSNVAIWELVFLDHDATEEELTKIKDYFVKTYPWLFPDQAWTVTGKTNEDTDRATIANITGNGNNLVLSNFGFAENSGYGLYAYNFNSFNLRDNVVKPTDVKKDSFRIIGTGNSSNVLILFNESDSADWKIRITGMKEGDRCLIGNANKSGDYFTITKDGIYTFQKQHEARSTNGVWYNSSQEVDVLIEQIPEYEGYLVTDGVDDRIQDSSFKLNKDWTLVGEWVLLNQKATNAGIVKPFSFVIYNRTTGLSLFINSGTSGTTIENVKSIKAICSDGRIYLDDWSEMLINKDQNITSSTSVLSIGFNGTAYTKIALKNLGIYNDQPLSKDDCIKAYNYLQTLKAK